jgi:hypothetical protein
MAWIKWAIIALAAFGAGGIVAAEPIVRQNDTQFRQAIETLSTSPYFVMITVVDKRSNDTSTGCVPSWALLGAIEREDGLGTVQAAQAKALAHPDHVFSFANPAALEQVRFDHDPKYALACDFIRRGYPAFMQDRTGQIRSGPQ